MLQLPERLSLTGSGSKAFTAANFAKTQQTLRRSGKHEHPGLSAALFKTGDGWHISKVFKARDITSAPCRDACPAPIARPGAVSMCATQFPSSLLVHYIFRPYLFAGGMVNNFLYG